MSNKVEENIEQLRAEYQQLHELLRTHDALRAAFYNDATVHAWFKQCEMGLCTLEEAFVGIIIMMAGEKKDMFTENVRLTALQLSPPTRPIE